MAEEGCEQLLGGLSAYLDGDASPDLCAEIEAHLAGCSDCRVVVDTLRKTLSLYHTAPNPDLPPEARERLFKALRLERFLPRE